MSISGFYENETAKKQMNDLNLFDFFKSKNIIRIKDNHIYFDPFFLSSIDENGNSCGYGNCTLSFSKLRLNYPEINEILENNKQNYVLDKLAAAGIEVVSDKEEFDKILESQKVLQKMTVDVVEFENISKEIQKLKNYNKNLEVDNKALVREQEFIDFQTSLIACKKYINDLPDKKLPDLLFATKNDKNQNISFIYIVKLQNDELVLTTPANTLIYNFETKAIENNFAFEKFKDATSENDYCEILINTINKHLGEELGKQRRRFKQLMEENAILSGKSLDELTEEETKELKEKLKEQEYENIEGILVHKNKRIAVTPDVYISEIQNAKLLVDHNSTVYLLPENFAFKQKNELGKNESYSTPDTLTNEEFLELKTTNKKIGGRFGDAVEQSNNVLIRIKDDISLYNAMKRIQEKINNLPKEKGIKVKDGSVFLYFEKSAKFISAEIKNGKIKTLPHTPDLSDFTESRPALSNIAHSSDKSSPQSMLQNGNTYGFAYEGKIYLNPDIMNSEVAVHEYTHLWDNYTQKTNPELWTKGKEIFKKTYLWDEVKKDPNYSEIKDNDDLVLSEAHSRICGKMADAILTKIAERDGILTKDTVIDWNKEVEQYIYETFESSRTTSDGRTIKSKGYGAFGPVVNVNTIRDFFAQPMKDLMNGIKITQNLDNNNNVIQKYTNSISEVEKKKNNITIADIKFLQSIGITIDKKNLETFSFIKNYFMPDKKNNPNDEKHLYSMIALEGFNSSNSKNYSKLGELICGNKNENLKARVLILGYLKELNKKVIISNEEKIKKLELIKEKLKGQQQGFMSLIQNDSISKEYKKIIIERALKYNLSEPQKETIINMAYEKAPTYVTQNTNTRTTGRVR